MSHYESRQSTEKKDRLALQCIEQLDANGLYRTVIDNGISMCGVIPGGHRHACRQSQRGQNCRLVGYTDSGYVSGDTGQVVGYAGIVIN